MSTATISTLTLTSAQFRCLFALDTASKIWRSDTLLARCEATPDDLAQLNGAGLLGAREGDRPLYMNEIYSMGRHAAGVHIRLTRLGQRRVRSSEFTLLASVAAEGGKVNMLRSRADKPALVNLVEHGLLDLHLKGDGNALSVREAEELLPRAVDIWLTVRGCAFIPSWMQS